MESAILYHPPLGQLITEWLCGYGKISIKLSVTLCKVIATWALGNIPSDQRGSPDARLRRVREPACLENLKLAQGHSGQDFQVVLARGKSRALDYLSIDNHILVGSSLNLLNLPMYDTALADSAAAGQATIYETCYCGRFKTIRGFSHDGYIWEVYCRCALCYCLVQVGFTSVRASVCPGGL